MRDLAMRLETEEILAMTLRMIHAGLARCRRLLLEFSYWYLKHLPCFPLLDLFPGFLQSFRHWHFNDHQVEFNIR